MAPERPVGGVAVDAPEVITDALRHRITPRRGVFRVEVVTPGGAVALVSTWLTEDEAVQQLRLLQLATERLVMKKLAAEAAPV